MASPRSSVPRPTSKPSGSPAWPAAWKTPATSRWLTGSGEKPTNDRVRSPCVWPFYGNQFLTADRQSLTPQLLSPDEQLIAEDLALDLLHNAAAESPHAKDAGEARRAIAQLTAGPHDAQRRPGRIGARAVAALDRIPWFTRGGLAGLALTDRTLAQVTRYLSDTTIRMHAINQVTQHLDPHTRVVIGHSLGSVIAYEALRTMPPTTAIPLLVTLGSPLGLTAICSADGFGSPVWSSFNVAPRCSMLSSCSGYDR